MKIGKRFNRLSKQQYLHYIKNHKKYTDFNILGIYRSLIESNKLSLEDKIEIRDFAHQYFQKTFDFLILKDPFTYFDVSTLGLNLNTLERTKIWQQIREQQEVLFRKKQFNHRSFGVYSKHSCGLRTCDMDNVMVKPNWHSVYHQLWFPSDTNRYYKKEKAKRRRKERKHKARLIKEALETMA